METSQNSILWYPLNNKPENIIFLDIDGVLNNEKSILFYHDTLCSEDYFDRRSLDLLSKLCGFCDCKVVLSSSWRRGLKDNLTPIHRTTKYYDTEDESRTARLLRLLKKNNIPLIGRTDLKNYTDGKWDRSGQIARFIEQYLKPEDKFVIFDDEDFRGGMNRFANNFIITDWKYGLQEKDIEKALDILL